MNHDIIYRTRPPRRLPNPFRLPRREPDERILPLQESPLAGFDHYRGRDIWPFMQEGEPLYLHREADNPHDPNAISVWYRNEKIGYVPRSENHHLARMMDRGQHYSARIIRLQGGENPWDRVRLRIEKSY